MKTPRSLALAGVVSLVATLAGCASASQPTSTAATVPASAAAAKLARNLSGAQVRALLGSPANVKPLPNRGVKAENWSYAFAGSIDTRLVPISTQEVPAINPLTGQAITRTEPVYQNQDLQTVDTLHLLLINDQLVEWRVMRDEKKKFQ